MTMVSSSLTSTMGPGNWPLIARRVRQTPEEEVQYIAHEV